MPERAPGLGLAAAAAARRVRHARSEEVEGTLCLCEASHSDSARTAHYGTRRQTVGLGRGVAVTRTRRAGLPVSVRRLRERDRPQRVVHTRVSLTGETGLSRWRVTVPRTRARRRLEASAARVSRRWQRSRRSCPRTAREARGAGMRRDHLDICAHAGAGRGAGLGMDHRASRGRDSARGEAHALRGCVGWEGEQREKGECDRYLTSAAI